MRGAIAVAFSCAVLAATGISEASECNGNRAALGTGRVIGIDPAEHGRIGKMNYAQSLPLDDREVVLTFDDGPLPPYTNRVLETLASHCTLATFFMVGKMAKDFPGLVRRTYLAGHTIATHSQTHPFNMQQLPAAEARKEIEDGIASIAAALGDERALAPFFRFPGFGRTAEAETYLAARGLMVWSADFPADDWTRISAKEVLARALERLERHGKGVLLLHDIQPATVLALPELLQELQKRQFRIVHAVPAGAGRPNTIAGLQQWVRAAALQALPLPRPRPVSLQALPLQALPLQALPLQALPLQALPLPRPRLPAPHEVAGAAPRPAPAP